MAINHLLQLQQNPKHLYKLDNKHLVQSEGFPSLNFHPGGKTRGDKNYSRDRRKKKRSEKLHLKKWDFLPRSIKEILRSNKPKQLSRIPAVPPQHSTAAGFKNINFYKCAPNKLSVTERCWGGGSVVNLLALSHSRQVLLIKPLPRGKNSLNLQQKRNLVPKEKSFWGWQQ